MDNLLIERMKNTLARYKHLTALEQSCLRTIKRSNCEFLDGQGVWCPLCKADDKTDFSGEYRYRIKADYNPTPQISKYKVETLANGEIVFQRYGWNQLLGNAVNHASFVGYEYEDGTVITFPRIYSTIGMTTGDDRTSPALLPKYVLFTGDFK